MDNNKDNNKVSQDVLSLLHCTSHIFLSKLISVLTSHNLDPGRAE